ncbi:Nuclear transport factor 2 OS=Schizosaccharomyces pombe (strain 972 / ATCC 24843) GN=ntf2 PE=3 SV=2 [Rhizoctonia solani AG-1 IB]|uniref:Nuclear transport factor 2 n=1 Tax=Thanatephorus cucumeris (strain AG1-IB / isolate 7/3/14) TaxID=1108050 RepID=A0A0B7F3L1_THACB|nr:Nuclear transport factor 2 OS=Schizosaccharomyces pombe (strain 972 / ATCC 24843) GN=ntf2 PE=3 SV=2 [Rhizoctonia solani AG-1 IB]
MIASGIPDASLLILSNLNHVEWTQGPDLSGVDPGNPLPYHQVSRLTEMEDITNQFTSFYYPTLSGDRNQLVNIYKADSILSWEGNQYQGVESILEKLKAFPDGVQFKLVTKDFQMCGDKMIVLVTGQLITEPGANPVHFSQAFTLAGNGAGGFYVANDLFRLNYG